MKKLNTRNINSHECVDLYLANNDSGLLRLEPDENFRYDEKCNYSPGPWQFGPGSPIVCSFSKYSRICDICMVFHWTRYPSVKPSRQQAHFDREVCSNTKLIERAPELLYYLENVVEQYADICNLNNIMGTPALIRQAYDLIKETKTVPASLVRKGY